MSPLTSCILFLSVLVQQASSDRYGVHETHLASYVTQPQIRAPKFNVTKHDPTLITPGYWFIAPYVNLKQDPRPSFYHPCQEGPLIYDDNGELIWSGACLDRNRNAFDFRVTTINGSQHLSYILGVIPEITGHSTGYAVIMDSSYRVQQEISPVRYASRFNMHEFRIVEDGGSALLVTEEPRETDISHVGKGLLKEAWVDQNGFAEIDLSSQQVLFDWQASDHVSLDERLGLTPDPDRPGSQSNPWDLVHINSVDKSSNGDYLVSIRSTGSILKISGKDGSVIWRLGGKNSTFILDGFTFAAQHDARFIQENEAVTIISFLDNASTGFTKTENFSSAMLVALYTSSHPPVAKVVRRWARPDRGLTRWRGNVQKLPSDNFFINWATGTYLTEFTHEGSLVMEARLQAGEFANYRGYKFNFTALPVEPPISKSFVYGKSPSSAVSVHYVSWNGATEVRSWTFYGAMSTEDEFMVLGSTPRTGFETQFVNSGFIRYAYAEAVAANGTVLGHSESQEVTVENPSQGVLDHSKPRPSGPHGSHESSQEYEKQFSPLVHGFEHQSYQRTLPTIKLLFLLAALSGLMGLVMLCYMILCRRRRKSGSFDFDNVHGHRASDSDRLVNEGIEGAPEKEAFLGEQDQRGISLQAFSSGETSA